MAKKKQPDFQPTKLRVGKRLPKGRNVTDTSFKSKKIVTKDQKFKTSSQEIPLADLLRLARHTNVSIKIDAIKKIGKYVEKNIYSLPSYFSDILNAAGKILLEDNGKVRQEAKYLIEGCLDSLSTPQMNCFMGALTTHIDCMMTHMRISVRRDSLDLLSAILKSHKNLICHSTKLLGNLLDMISSVTRATGHLMRKRKLDDNINSSITSVEWRDQVLKLIVEFLQTLVDIFTEQKKVSGDEQKVYWDGKRPLHVPLYAGSGLTPAKLELYSPGQIKSGSEITKELRSFFGDLVKVSSDVVTEEIASLEILSGCNILRHDNIRRLNTVTQVLCCLGHWYKLGFKIDSEEDPDFLPLMFKIVCEKLMKGFPYSLHDSSTRESAKKAKEEECMHLNLGIGYLYSTFILGTECSDKNMERLVIICLCEALGLDCNLDIKSLSLVLKITKNFVEYMSSFSCEAVTPFAEEISEILGALCGILDSRRKTDAVKELQSFFIDIALDYDYKFLLEYVGIKRWINHMFYEMRRMKMDKKADKRILKCINQICTREYPTFISALNNSDPLEILDYLKLEDEDFQFTVMNLITHMTHLPPDFLQDIADLILCDQYMSPKTVVRFIRLLNDRFLDPRVCPEEYYEFVKFLLNVGMDVASIDRAEEESSAMNQISIENARTISEEEMNNEQSKQTEELYQNSSVTEDSLKTLLLTTLSKCQYYIVPPPRQWERHTEIFEVCLECLLLYPARDHIVKWTNSFLEELPRTKAILPVHSAIALLKFAQQICLKDKYFSPNEPAVLFDEEVTLSILYYISIITNQVPKEKLKCFGVAELQRALCLSREKAIRTLQCLTYRAIELGWDERFALYALRFIKFFITWKYIDANDVINYGQILQMMESFCPKKSEGRAVLLEIYAFVRTHGSQ